MISCFVFSKNRPCQLDAFLSSLENAPYITDVAVLYTYEHQKFTEGYDKVKGYHPQVRFVHEDVFAQNVIDLVGSAQKYFLWATDDSVFYKPADISEDKLDWVFNKQPGLALNLRMGLNIKWQNHWHSDISRPINVKDRYQDIVIWDAMEYSVETDAGRVWQNDASIMPRDKYLDRLKVETDWLRNKSRSLDGLANCGRIFQPCYMAAPETSVYLNVPVNLVHYLDDGRLYADNWGRFIKQDLNVLHDKFMGGHRIDWRAIHDGPLDCGRKEVEYQWRQNGQ